MTVTLVVARARNGVIGAGGAIPWYLPEDFKHFKTLTYGHPIVMGRVTFESIGRPLPGRASIVVTRDAEWSHEGVETEASVVDAVNRARELDDEVFVIGGAQIYAEALAQGLVDRLVVSEVEAEPEGDTWFQVPDDWREVEREAREGFDIVTYSRP